MQLWIIRRVPWCPVRFDAALWYSLHRRLWAYRYQQLEHKLHGAFCKSPLFPGKIGGLLDKSGINATSSSMHPPTHNGCHPYHAVDDNTGAWNVFCAGYEAPTSYPWIQIDLKNEYAIMEV